MSSSTEEERPHHAKLASALRQRDINYIVVHCSATRPEVDYTAWQCHLDHTDPNGNLRASRIGYHFFIERSGRLVRGRDIDDVGAHVRGHNEDSLGICLAGGYDSRGRAAPAYTPEQWATLKMLLQSLRTMYPDAEILGHRDFPDVNKACPSFDVGDWCENNL